MMLKRDAPSGVARRASVAEFKQSRRPSDGNSIGDDLEEVKPQLEKWTGSATFSTARAVVSLHPKPSLHSAKTTVTPMPREASRPRSRKKNMAPAFSPTQPTLDFTTSPLPRLVSTKIPPRQVFGRSLLNQQFHAGNHPVSDTGDPLPSAKAVAQGTAAVARSQAMATQVNHNVLPPLQPLVPLAGSQTVAASVSSLTNVFVVAGTKRLGMGRSATGYTYKKQKTG